MDLVDNTIYGKKAEKLRKKIDEIALLIAGKVYKVFVPTDGIISEAAIDFVGSVTATSDTKSITFTAFTTAPGFIYCFTKELTSEEQQVNHTVPYLTDFFNTTLQRKRTSERSSFMA